MDWVWKRSWSWTRWTSARWRSSASRGVERSRRPARPRCPTASEACCLSRRLARLPGPPAGWRPGSACLCVWPVTLRPSAAGFWAAWPHWRAGYLAVPSPGYQRDARVDRRALAQPEVCEAFLTNYLQAFRRGSWGVGQDLRVLTRPWGFDLDSIMVRRRSTTGRPTPPSRSSTPADSPRRYRAHNSRSIPATATSRSSTHPCRHWRHSPNSHLPLPAHAGAPRQPDRPRSATRPQVRLSVAG